MRITLAAMGALAGALVWAMSAPAAPAPAARDVCLSARAAMEDRMYAVAERLLTGLVSKSRRRSMDDAAAAEAIGLLGRALFEQGKYAAMLTFFDPAEGWVRPAAGEASFWFWRAAALDGQGDVAGARDALTKANWAAAPAEYRSRVLRLRAAMAIKEGNTPAALEAFAAFDREFGSTPQSPENLVQWARTLLATGRVDEAEQTLGRLALHPSNQLGVAEGLYWQGHILARRGATADASRVYLRLGTAAYAPPNLRAQAWLAEAGLRTAPGESGRRLGALSNAVYLAVQPETRRTAEYEYGLRLIEAGQLEPALVILRSCIQAEPGDARARPSLLRLAGALAAAGRYAEAGDACQHFIETYAEGPDLAEAYRGLGWALFKLGRFAESAAAFGSAYGRFTDPVLRAECQFRKADALLANAQYRVAAEMYAQLLQEFPDSPLAPEALYQTGECQVGDADLDSAAATFAQVAERYPQSSAAGQALLRLARVRESRQLWMEAIDAYNRLIATPSPGPLAAEGLHGRGMLYHRLFRFEEALADFTRVVSEFPTSPVAEKCAYMQAMGLFGLWRDADAVNAMRLFLDRHPASALAPRGEFWLGEYAYNHGEYESAEKQFVAFADRHAADEWADDALLRAGLAASRRKEYLRAVELYNRLVKDFPSSPRVPEARFAQGEALIELAQFPAAVLVFDEIIARYPDSSLIWQAWGRKGDCQFMMGADDPARYEEGMASYAKVAAGAAAGADLVLQAEYKKGRCLEKLGRTDEALDQYYAKVIVRYFEDAEKGVWHNEAARVWFTCAAFNAADLMSAAKDWRGVVRVLERVVAAGVPAAREAEARIGKVRSEHWWLFY